MENKIFCGSGKEFGQYGAVGLNVCLSDLPKEWITDYKGKKYIKLTLRKMKTPKEKQTHYLEVNTWKPDQQAKPVDTPTDNGTVVDADIILSNDEVPF